MFGAPVVGIISVVTENTVKVIRNATAWRPHSSYQVGCATQQDHLRAESRNFISAFRTVTWDKLWCVYMQWVWVFSAKPKDGQSVSQQDQAALSAGPWASLPWVFLFPQAAILSVQPKKWLLKPHCKDRVMKLFLLKTTLSLLHTHTQKEREVRLTGQPLTDYNQPTG